MDALAGVTILCWLLGRVPDPDLHGGRLRMLFEKLVDTPVRGVRLRAPRCASGAGAIARDAARALATSRVEIVEPGGDRARGGGPAAGAIIEIP